MSALSISALLLGFGVVTNAQEVISNIVGTVVDTSGAVVPGATIKLTNTGNNTARTASTSAAGVFRFPNLSQGVYTLSVQANGFQTHTTTQIRLDASTTLDLGKIALAVGSQAQEVSVTAAATPIQTSSSEVSHTITGAALDSLPLVGRDVFGAMKLDPGVVSNANYDVVSEFDLGSLHIDGNTKSVNFTVDGVSDLDTGCDGCSLHYEPNEDAIQEVKILSSNYDAEYGRNSGGMVEVITKSGTSKLHGSLWAYHRHEEFNANSWSNNRRGLSRPLYRFNIDGWSLGGPVPFGWLKNRLYFFGSQEYTNQLGSNTVEDVMSPTAAERSGDFSSTVDGKGNPIYIFDPLTHAQFPSNRIPAAGGPGCGTTVSCINPDGQAILNYFPLPNFVGTAANGELNQANFQQQASAGHPHRNDVLRIDFNPTSKLTTYFRWIRDYDESTSLFNGNQFNTAPISHPNSGHGYAWSGTYVFSPTLINTVTVGKSWNTWSWYFLPGSLAEVSRNSTLNPPTLFPLPTSPEGVNGYDPLLPSFSFGNAQPNMMNHNTSGLYNYFNANNIWTVDDDVSKVAGAHQFKTGIYIEYNTKLQPAGNGYAGNYNFQNDTNNPNSTAGSCASCGPGGTALSTSGDGYANALLGLYDSYSQSTGRTTFNVAYWNAEWYAQDSWRVSRKLTLDLGLRFYHQTPQLDLNSTFSEFNPALFVNQQTGANKAGILYIPGCTMGGAQVSNATLTAASKNCKQYGGTVNAVDPNNPTVAAGPAAYIGAFLPGINHADGMVALGKSAPYTTAWMVAAPRVGFAYDVFGDGKTALRGGFGVFYDRLDGNQVYGMSGQEPLVETQSVSQGNMANLSTTKGVVAPSGVNTFNGLTPIPKVENASLGVQHELGFQTSLDVSWVGNYSFQQDIGENINAVPLGANFAPNNISPATGSPLTQDGSSLERVIYPGFQNINKEVFYGHSNYNSLQVTLEHRLSHNVLFGAAYTWSRSLGVTGYDPLVPNNNARNYGLLGTNRNQVLVVNYSWALPSVGNNVVGAVLNHWTFSGLSTFSSGSPYGVGFNAFGDYTGSTNEGVRLNEVSNPMENIPAGDVFNPAAFAAPPLGSLTSGAQIGNLGVNPFQFPSYQDWDMTLSKFIPVGFNEGSGFQLQVQAYNVFNHPQFTSWGTNLSSASSLAQPTGTQEARIMAFNLRYTF